MPGMFCEVIVTMNSGTATAMSAPAFQVGATSSMTGMPSAGARSPKVPAAPITTTDETRAPGPAQRRANAISTNTVDITGRIATGYSTTARTGAATRVGSQPGREERG